MSNLPGGRRRIRVILLDGRVMLEAQSLSKSYGSVVAVHDVPLRLEPGQVLGYLGPNGSGKSTTVKMLTGLLEPTHGCVSYGGVDIHKHLVSYSPPPRLRHRHFAAKRTASPDRSRLHSLGPVAAAESLNTSQGLRSILVQPHPPAEFLAVPFIAIYCVLTGIRFAFEMPADLRANWIFRMWLPIPTTPDLLPVASSTP